MAHILIDATNSDIRIENIMFKDYNDIADVHLSRRRYYIVDSGLSVQLKPVKPKKTRRTEEFKALGPTDRIQDIPEVSLTTLNDPFLSDMYMVGNVIHSTILTVRAAIYSM